MCLAIPGKITKLDQKKQSAVIDYGSGTTRKANVSLVQVKIGDYVLVHAGFAIHKLDKEAGEETLRFVKEITESDPYAA